MVSNEEMQARINQYKKYQSMGIEANLIGNVWKGDIKYQSGLPFLKKYLSQWHTSYWCNGWWSILSRLPPFERKWQEVKNGWIPADLLLEAEKWLRFQCSNNNGSCYAGYHKYIWKTEWAEEYCIKNKINPVAFSLTSRGIDLAQIMNDSAEWV